MRYVAFLRAINVGGHIVKMDRLRGLFEELSLVNVETFIASGNVIFESKTKAPTLEAKIEKHLHRSLGYPAETFLRECAKLPEIASVHPFLKEEEKAHALYVGFLKETPGAEGRKKLTALGTRENVFHLEGRELYWLCYERESALRLAGGVVERAIGVPVTMRNVSTVRKLSKKLGLTA